MFSIMADVYAHEMPSYCSERSNDYSTCVLHSELTFPPFYTCTGAGVLHIAEQILQSLDVKSLVKSEQVSSIWRDVIGDLHIWKHLIKHNVDSKPLWRALFKRRGWLVRKRVGTDVPSLMYILFHNLTIILSCKEHQTGGHFLCETVELT